MVRVVQVVSGWLRRVQLDIVLWWATAFDALKFKSISHRKIAHLRYGRRETYLGEKMDAFYVFGLFGWTLACGG